jgi:hypothetical protein
MDTVIGNVLWDAYRGHMHRLHETRQKLDDARQHVASLESEVEYHQTSLAEIASHADVNDIDVVAEYERCYSMSPTTQVAFVK